MTATVVGVGSATPALAHGAHELPTYFDQGLAFVVLGADRLAGAATLGAVLVGAAPAASVVSTRDVAQVSALPWLWICGATGLFLLAFGVGLNLGFDRALALIDVVTPVLLCGSGALLMIAPWRWSRWSIPPFALAYGLLLGVMAFLDGPADAAWLWFAAGAAFGGVIVAAGMFVTLRQFGHRLAPVAFQIIGSWLLAAGLMIGAIGNAPVSI